MLNRNTNNKDILSTFNYIEKKNAFAVSTSSENSILNSRNNIEQRKSIRTTNVIRFNKITLLTVIP